MDGISLIKRRDRSIYPQRHIFKLGFFLSIPLQFSKFGETPLLFVYFETYHYNFLFLAKMTRNTYEDNMGPAAGVLNTYIALKTLSPITYSRAPHVIFFFILSCRPPPPIFSLLLPCRLCISSSLLRPRAAASTPQGSAGRTSSRAAWHTGSSARRSWPPSLPCSLPGQERGVASGRPETRCGVAHGRPLPCPPPLLHPERPRVAHGPPRRGARAGLASEDGGERVAAGSPAPPSLPTRRRCSCIPPRGRPLLPLSARRP